MTEIHAAAIEDVMMPSGGIASKALITGVKLVATDSDSRLKPCFEVHGLNGAVDYIPLTKVPNSEIVPWHDRTPDNLRLEEVARTICDAMEGDGASNWLVSSYLQPRTLTGLFVLPNPMNTVRLWQHYLPAAKAVIGAEDPHGTAPA